MAEFKSRIGQIEGYAMIAVAFVFDLISIIPFLNIVSEILAAIVFGIWFITNGVPPKISYKVGATAVGSAIIGFIPLLSILPEMTSFILITLYMYKKEETRESAEKAAQTGSKSTNRAVTVQPSAQQPKIIGMGGATQPLSQNVGRVIGDLNPEEETDKENPMDPKRATKLYGREFQNGKRFMGARQGIIFGGGAAAGRGLLQNAKPTNFKDPRASKSGLDKTAEEVAKGLTSVTKTAGQATAAGGKGVSAVGTGLKASGTAVNVTGKAVSGTGKVVSGVSKGVSMGGSAAMKAGASLSTTGVGAIVGVPLAILGGAATALGKTGEVAGKVVEKTGDVTSAAGKGINKAGEGVQRAGKIVQKAGNTTKEIAQLAKDSLSDETTDLNLDEEPDIAQDLKQDKNDNELGLAA